MVSGGLSVTRADSGSPIFHNVIDNSTVTGQTVRGFYTSNPASMVFRDSLSLSGASVGFDKLSLSRAEIMQEGEGGNDFMIHINSYYKLSPKVTVWGEADYTKRTIDNIRFTDALDYHIIAPYTMGDSEGGDVSTQRYRFAGGWAKDFGQWTFGLEARYRAEIGHRSHDPRVKDVVSDLDVAAGVSRKLRNNLLGLNLGLKVYHQDCDVLFLNQSNTINTLVYSGMGGYFSRFAGNTCESAGHKATGINAGLQWLPIDGQGLMITVSGTLTNAKMTLRDFNNLTPGKTATTELDLSAGWKFNLGNFSILPMLYGAIDSRDGKETILGSGSGGVYEKLGERKTYENNRHYTGIKIPVEWNCNSTILSATPMFAISGNEEKLVETGRSLKVDHLTCGIDLNGLIPMNGKSFITLSTGFYNRSADAGTPVWAGLDTSEGAGIAVKNNYDMACADRSVITAEAGYSIAFGGQIYSINADYVHCSYKDLAHGNGFSVTLGIKF